MRPTSLIPVLALVAASLPVLVGSAAEAAPAAARQPARHGTTSRAVVFDLVNTNETSVACVPDRREHAVHARLIGPRSIFDRSEPVVTVNVLVHDAGTGGWFWNLTSNPSYDYARQLARAGQTSLVVDRLGYDSSRLADGNGTCLGAQVAMLHQMVQSLYAGQYHPARGHDRLPVASHVVLQGHGTGATIVQLEASTYDDVRGVVLMSQPTTSHTQLALGVARGQATACRSHDYAAWGSTAAYRRLLFATAPAGVQRTAVRLRNPTPCGDVTSLPSALLAASLGAGQVKVPVLQLDGSADARRRSTAGASYRSSAKVTTRTIRGAGSALPLERSAPRTRAIVLAWLKTLKGF